jgi:hypothetical protein
MEENRDSEYSDEGVRECTALDHLDDIREQEYCTYVAGVFRRFSSYFEFFVYCGVYENCIESEFSWSDSGVWSVRNEDYDDIANLSDFDEFEE